jgi:uncharacterized protein YdaL
MSELPYQLASAVWPRVSRLFLLGALLFTGIAAAAENPPQQQTVAIIYDGPTDYQAKGYIHALFVDQLLGHFGLTGEIIPSGNYRPGMLARYHAGFYIGVTPGATLPAGLVDDVRKYGQPFAWLGQHVEGLVNTPEGRRQFGFAWQEYNRNLGVTGVRYKDELLPKHEPDLSIVSVTDRRNVQVVATAATRGGETYPYVLHRGRFWYFADSPFAYPDEGGHYLAFCDLLHDILEVQHPEDRRALVRIEDVSIDQDPVDLRRVSDLLQGYHIPFQIALIPIFKNPSKELEVRLSDRKSFVDSIHYMVAHGGTVVMHGVTHQYRGQSGDDYEFWDDTGDRPVAGDSTEFVMRRLQLGMQECFNAGIYPVAFETPHYAASETDYRALMRVFTLFYDRTISTPSLNSQQYFPYPVVDYWGRDVLPEDLGYVPEENQQSHDILQAARNLRVVRDGVASFYFHPFLKANLLDQLVRGIQDLGYHFVSIRDFPSAVDFQGRYVVRTSSGESSIAPQNEFWRLREYDREGKLIDTRLSDRRLTGHMDVAVTVPPGGWAAVDLLKEPPAAQTAPTLAAQARHWWTQLVSSEENNRTAATQTFAAGQRSAWILWLDKAPPAVMRNQQSYRNVLETFGYEVKPVKPGDFTRAPADRETILIVPEAAGARLSAAQQQSILRYLDAGGHVVAEGKQEWLKQLGFVWQGRQLTLSAVADDLYPEMPVRWRPDVHIERFDEPDGVRELMTDSESDQMLAFSGDRGAGHYIYLAAPLDDHTTDGTSHYPYFPRYLIETFGVNTALRSPRIEAYFDPSYKTTADWDRLAIQWRKSGIRTVYTAAWIFTSKDNWSFRYGDFIKACHRNGVSVYAWFWFPQVTPRFWDDHPEWREKTASGDDGHVVWRKLMNFQNPDCFKASMDWMKGLLNQYEWDGVNISELNFDYNAKDPFDPKNFVPMDANVRADFHKHAGFDPIQLFQPTSQRYYKFDRASFDKFMRYRENLVMDMHRKVLTELEPIRRARNFEVIVSTLDSLHSKNVRPGTGLDSRRLVALMKDFDFTLQVQDPSEYWMKPPDRYRRFAETYKKLVKDPSRFMFDVNVVHDRNINATTLPTFTATGTELVRTVMAAAASFPRVAIYSEDTVPMQDWSLLRIALTNGSTFTGGGGAWKIGGDEPVLLTPAEDRDYYMDGRLWPAVSPDGVLAPPGRHGLSISRPWYHFLDPGTMPARLMSISGDLLDARVMPTGLIFRYSSPGRAVAVFNERPRDILVDGRRVRVPMEQGTATWSAMLPGGEHWVAAVTNTKAGVAVNLWGWASASAINALGGLATGLMLLIYFEVRLRRIVRRRA